MMSKILSPNAIKLYTVILYAAVGAAVQSGLLPDAVKHFLSDHAAQAVLVALGLGHVMPEAGKK